MPENGGGALATDASYNRFEYAIILVLVVIFAGLFVWFSTRPNQQLFEYYLFALTATLVISGVLKAVGQYTKPGIALGGAIVIFGAIFYITKQSYDADISNRIEIGKVSREKQDEIDKLTHEKQAIEKQRDDKLTSLAQLQAKYDALLDQDIVIVTYTATERPLMNVIIEYVSSAGQLAQAEDSGNIHTVHRKDLLPSGSAIRVKFDSASLPAARISRDEDRVIRIDRMTYQINPLTLRLYLDPDN